MGTEADTSVRDKLRDDFANGMDIPNAARFYTVGKGIAATPIAGSPTPSRLGIPYGAATIEEGLKDVADLKSHNVHFIKVWVDDRVATVPKVKPEVYRAIIDQAHKNGQEVLAHLGQTTALADAKDLLKAGVDGFVHVVRDRDVDDVVHPDREAASEDVDRPEHAWPAAGSERHRSAQRNAPVRAGRAEQEGARGQNRVRQQESQRTLAAPLPQLQEDPRRRHGDRARHGWHR